MKSLLRGVKKRSAVVPRPLLVISSAVALSLLGDQMLYAVLPAVHEAVGVPVTAVGLLLSANRLIRLLTNSLAGYVIERFGRHWPFVLALLLGGITTVAYGVVYGVWAFLVARLLPWGGLAVPEWCPHPAAGESAPRGNISQCQTVLASTLVTLRNACDVCRNYCQSRFW
jgi:MFS family permease